MTGILAIAIGVVVALLFAFAASAARQSKIGDYSSTSRVVTNIPWPSAETMIPTQSKQEAQSF